MVSVAAEPPAANEIRPAAIAAVPVIALAVDVSWASIFRALPTVNPTEDYSFPYSQVFGFMASFCRDGRACAEEILVVPIGTKDYSSVIAAIPDNVDAIFVALGGADGVNFLTQYQQAGGTAPLIGGSITVDQTVLGTQGKQRDYVVGTPSAGPIADNSDEPPGRSSSPTTRPPTRTASHRPRCSRRGITSTPRPCFSPLDKVGGDLSDKEAKFRDVLAKLQFDTPTGLVKLDKNRQAIADNYLTEVAKADDGHLYNKVIKVVHDVNQTLGIPEADFPEAGLGGSRQPRLQVNENPDMAGNKAAERLSTNSVHARSWRGVGRQFGALVALADIDLKVGAGERRAILGSNGAGKTTLFNAVTGDFPPTSGRIRFFGEGDITAFPVQERIRRGLRRTYQISQLFGGLTVLDSIFVACRGVSNNRLSLLRPSQEDATMAQARSIAHSVHLDDILETPVVGAEPRPATTARNRAGADRRAALHPVRRTRSRPVAVGAARSRRHPQRPAGLHRLHQSSRHDLDVALRVSTYVTMMHNGRIFTQGTPEEIENDARVQEIYLGAGHG